MESLNGGGMSQLPYRESDPEDWDCGDEQEEFEAIRAYVRNVLAQSSEIEVLDFLLVLCNVCNARSFIHGLNPNRSEWYKRLGEYIRILLTAMSTETNAPNIKLENPELYFPPEQNMH